MMEQNKLKEMTSEELEKYEARKKAWLERGGKRKSSGEQRKRRSNALPERGWIQNTGEREETVCGQFDMFSCNDSVCLCVLLSFFNFSSFSVLVLYSFTSHTSILQHYHFSLYLHHCIPLSSLLEGHTVELRER